MITRFFLIPVVFFLFFIGCASHDLDESLKDEGNCSTEVSFANEVKAIISLNCSVPTCHDGSLGVSLDFRTFDNIQINSDRIVSVTRGGAMPPSVSGLFLTEEEITTISCWVLQGSRNN